MNKGLSIDSAKSIVFLVAALVMTVTWAVGATGWTKGLSIVTFIGLGVILIGLMLARSILPGVIAHLFSLIIGIGWSFWVTSRLLPPTFTWLERWQNLVGRLEYWYSQAIQGGTSYDNLMFILQMNVIVWMMGYLTIWFVFRSSKVWQAIVPGGLVLLINLYYAPHDITLWFLFYIMLSLLLVIRFNLHGQESKWRAEGIFFRPDISFDFFRDGFIFSVLIIAIAWLTPPVVNAKSLGMLDEFQGTWRQIQSEWNRLYADLDYRNTGVVDSFGQSLMLGGPRRLTDAPVMDVHVEGLGRYWRAAVYDEYTGTGWRSRDTASASFGPQTALTLPYFEARVPVTQTYTFYRDGATVLYAMSNPISLDRSARVRFNALSDEEVMQAPSQPWLGESAPWVEEITYIRSNATIDKGESYQVVSAASQATIQQLRLAGTDYPIWVSERYLQLPNTITKRTLDLAREITKNYNNPFDKAQAIERYLRSELTYNEQLPTPPAGVDRVDYILFTAKEAYCDYYASSMIVMLRSLGIPARLTAGFARGTYDSEKDVFHVINADAHSWVEVYFPRYGWIEFEPTAAQPVIIRPTSTEFDNSFASSSIPPGDFPGQEGFPDRPENVPIDDENIALPFALSLPWLNTQINLPRGLVMGGLTVVGAALLVTLIGGGLWWRQQIDRQSTEGVSQLYQRMIRLSRWVGITLYPWQTPYEHSVILQRRLPTHQREIKQIIHEYVHWTFSRPGKIPEHGEMRANSEAYHSNRAWQRLRSVMIKAAIRQRLPRWLKNHI